MRLFELARELNTTPRDLFKQAEVLDVEVFTYITELDADDTKTLRSGYRQRSSVEIADDKVAMLRKLDEKHAASLEAAEASHASESKLLQESIERAEAAGEDFLSRTVAASAAEEAPETPKAPEVTGVQKERLKPAEVAVAPGSAPDRVAVGPDAGEAAAPLVEANAKEEAEADKGVLRSLPQRPLQAPRPEFVAPAPAPAPVPETPARPAAVEPVAAKPAAEVKAPKKEKRPRGLHPLDEEDEEDVLLRGLSKSAKEPGPRAPLRGGKSAEKAGVDRGERLQRRGSRAEGQKSAAESSQEPEVGNVLRLRGPVVVKDLADKLGTRANIIITELMKMGILASINQSVEPDVATKIAEMHGFTVEQEKSRRSSDNRPVLKAAGEDDDIPEDRPDQLMPRPPEVSFLGHVAHGKTSLLDYIRNSNVIAGEAGGITQHIAAYSVDINGQKITFLDTPGHAAFSSMRARGANLTDIAVIIIAADDGIMPQTKEAVKHAREADVTIMVAINKCDLPQANTMRVMQQLQAENLTPEEWGGDTVVCQVSALTGDGVGNLLDMILLQSEVLELTANPNRRADGTVVEAQVKPGSGPIVSVLVTGGTLKVGDVVLCEEYYGHVRAIVDGNGRRLKSIGPSGAANVLGLSGVPEAGARFRVMTNDKRARELAEECAQRKKQELLGGITQARSVDDIFKKMHEAEKLELNIILRADVQGSVEAVQDSIEGIKSEKVQCNILYANTGSITTTDLQRAANSNAIIIGFNVSPESGVNSEARHQGVRIKTFRIIYELLDFVEQEMLDILPVEHREVVRGHAQVKQIFALSHIGNAAGSIVLDGVITMEGKARVLRNKKVVHSGAIASIRHFKDEVEEVSQAQECGILLADFEEFQEGDIIECFSLEALPKAL